MLRNYLTTFFRILVRENLYSIINILGLALGFASVLAIALFISDESKYDRFHKDADRIYRVVQYAHETGDDNYYARSGGAVALDMQADIPEIESATRINNWPQMNVTYMGKEVTAHKLIFADSNFFSFFSFHLLEGNPQTALRGPNNVVLTKSVVKALFPNDESPLGKLVLLKGSKEVTLKVTGVVEDTPRQSHFYFNIIVSLATDKVGPYWLDADCYTYIKVREDADLAAVDEKILSSSKLHMLPFFKKWNLDKEFKIGENLYFYRQALTDIHLDSHLEGELEVNGNRGYLYLLACIGAIIIALSCCNFLNLSTARASTRAREMAVRKIVGADRFKLVRQFILEAFLYSAISLLIAVGLLSTSLNAFNILMGKELHLGDLWGSSMLLLMLLLIATVTLVVGLVPFLYVGQLRVVESLRGNLQSGRSGSMLRSTLVVVQFAVSGALIIFTTTIYKQVGFLLDRNIGFSKEKVICVPGIIGLADNRIPFQNALKNNSAVEAASFSNFFPSEILLSSLALKHSGTGETFVFRTYTTDAEHDEALGLELVDGRFFDDKVLSDSASVVVNETAASMMGISSLSDSPMLKANYGVDYRIVGIIRDFNYESLHINVEPLLIVPPDKFNAGKSKMIIRLAKGNTAEQLESIRNEWSKLTSSPFEFVFLDQQLAGLYKSDRRLGDLAATFTTLGLVVACLGLLGLVTFLVGRRAKEIGIRRVLGATARQIVVMLTRDYTKLVLIAYLVSIPLGYYLIGQWLESFPYRVEVSPGSVIMMGSLILAIALFTVGLQALNATRQNPVNYLRNE